MPRELAGLVRYLRSATGLSQRALAEAAGTSTGTVAGWESAAAPPGPLERGVEAAGWRLSVLPAPSADPEADRRRLHWLDRHPFDRARDAAFDAGRRVAGLGARAWLRELDALRWHQGVIVGPAAWLFWVPAGPGVPPVRALDLITGGRPLERPTRQRGRLREHRDAASLGLPSHVVRAAVPIDPLSPAGLWLLHPRDLLLTAGWHDDLARTAHLLDHLHLLDAGLRHEPAHRRTNLERRRYESYWPSRAERRPVHIPDRTVRRNQRAR